MADFATQRTTGAGNIDDPPILLDDLLQSRLRQFTEFLEQEDANLTYNYKEGVRKMLDRGEVRLIVNLDDLRDYDRSYADG